MTDMLDYFKLDLIGRHHSGIDDCENISNVVIEMFKDGISIVTTTEYKNYEINRIKVLKDVKNFKITKKVDDLNPNLKFNEEK